MAWNYRVIELDDIDEGKYYEIKEVYYNRDGALMGYCDATVGGSSIGELVDVLNRMKESAHKRVLKLSNFKGETK